jgi:hypothetical protein
LHEKEQRFAVIYLYESALTTTMELWVLNRLSEGLFDGLQSIFSSGVSLPPAGADGLREGGMESRPLER